MREQQNIFANIDWLLIVTYLSLVFIGWISIYAAVYDEAHSSIMDIDCNYGKQLIFICVAFLVSLVIILLDPKLFSSFAWLYYIFVILVLIGVLVYGQTVSGAQSWFKIGPFSVQPGEFAKITTALALAKFLSVNALATKNMRTLILAIGIALLPALLILLQNDTGTALVYFALFLVMYREGMNEWVLFTPIIFAVLFIFTLLLGELKTGIILLSTLFIIWFFFLPFKFKKIKTIVLIAIVGVAFIFCSKFAFNVLSPHQKERIEVLLGMKDDITGAGYNVHQSLIAIGSGGATGKGFLKGTQTKYNFVPEQSTDFIFCTVGEEWGLFGCSVVIGLYVFLILRILRNADRQRSAFARIYGYGVASIFIFHFLINVGMVLGLLPVIGIPLPFLSYGGSSLFSFTILLFIFIKQDANRLSLL